MVFVAEIFKYVQLEDKCRCEKEALKAKLDKEYEQLVQSFHKEIEKLHNNHVQELEKRVWNQHGLYH